MIVLDAYALEAYLNDEVLAADIVEPLILSGQQVLITGVHLAEAMDRDAPLVTSDPALLGLVHDEGGRYVALPGSNGQVWSPTPAG